MGDAALLHARCSSSGLGSCDIPKPIVGSLACGGLVWVTVNVTYFASIAGQIGALMEEQADDESAAPLANSEQGDMPVAVEVPAVATSEAIPSTRTSRAWIRILPALIVLAVILIFVFQNPKDVRVSLFTFSGTLPLSVALLGAVVLGALMVLALGSVRIFQLRRQVHRKSAKSELD